MALTGNQPALMQARSGIMRSGASRSGYYRGDAVFTIDVDGVPQPVTPYVVHNGWQISWNLNDEVDTATISLLPTLPFVPRTRSPIRIGFGSASNVQFAGLIMTVQRSRRPGPDARFWYELTCVDWMAVLDAHLVVADYPAQSVTTTILDLVARFTRGNISTAGVPAGLPSVPGFSVVNERPSTILRRVTNKIGGGFWIDANRVLRAWSATVPSPIHDSDPQPLTDGLATLKTFRAIEDASQQRTRMWVEGQRTATMLAVPATTDQVSVPLREAHIFDDSRLNRTDFARLGSMITTPAEYFNPSLDPGANPPGTLTTAAVAAGATVLPVVDMTIFAATGWVAAGGQTVFFQRDATTGGSIPQELYLPAAGQYGALQAPLGAGAQVLALPFIKAVANDRLATTDPTWPVQSLVPMRAQPQGSPAVMVVKKQDDAAAATIAAREGSDGYYEHLVQDGRYSHAGATARADAELADFAQPLIAYEWDTEDLNAEPGRMQHIALTAGTPITDDVRITNVEVTPIATNHPPRRHVRANKVRTAGVVDVWVDDAR